MPHDERRMTHHVVEDAPALEPSLPEPWHVRTGVFLGRARQIRSPRGRRAARPQQCLAGLDVRREELVLEIAGRNTNRLRDRSIRTAPPDVDVARELGGGSGVLRIRAPDAEDVAVPNAAPPLHV